MVTNVVYILKTYFFLLYFILFSWPSVSSFHAHLLALSHITVILDFCNHWILFHMLLFSPPLIRKGCTKTVPRLLNDDRRSAACRCVRTSSSIFKLNQTCFKESSLRMRHGFFSTTQKPSARDVSGSLQCHWGRRKQDSQNQKSKSCWSRSSMRPQWVLATGPDDQSASLQRDPATFASLSMREETRVAARQIVAASPWQCTCSQCPEHPAVLGREENCHTGTIFLFTWSCSVWLFSFPQAQGGYQGDLFWRRGGHQEGRNDSWGVSQKNPSSSA